MSRIRNIEARYDRPCYRPSSTQALNDIRHTLALLDRYQALAREAVKQATRRP
jgi:hypothetical protein